MMEAIVAVFVISLVVAAVALTYSLLTAEKTKSTSTTGSRSSLRLSKSSLKRLNLFKS
jgi:hypothetical protein